MVHHAPWVSCFQFKVASARVLATCSVSEWGRDALVPFSLGPLTACTLPALRGPKRYALPIRSSGLIVPKPPGFRVTCR